MYSAHDSRRAYNPYPSTSSSSQPSQLPTNHPSYFFPENASYGSATLVPQQPSVGVQTRLASSSLASALDISRVSTNRLPRPQGEASASGSRHTAPEVVSNGPYLNQGILPSPKSPQVGARQTESNTPAADTMLPQHNEDRIVHGQQGYVYSQQALPGQQELYMDQANTAFDYSWGAYGDSMLHVGQQNIYTHNHMYEQAGPSGSAPTLAMYGETLPTDNDNSLLGFDSQATQGNSYPTWESLGMLPPTTGENYTEFSDLVAGAWPPQMPASTSFAPYDASVPSQGVSGAGTGAEPQPDYGLSQIGSGLPSSQLGQHDEPQRQTQAPIDAPVDPPTTEDTALPPMPDVQFASARGVAPIERRQNLQGGVISRPEPSMIGAGATNGYGIQDYFSHVNVGTGNAMLQNQSFFQVQQYGQPGIMESSSRALAPPSQGQSAARAKAHFPEMPPDSPSANQADNTRRAAVPENRPAAGRRHTVAAPIDPDKRVQQRAQAVAGSSSAPSSPLENAGNAGPAKQASKEATGPRTPTPAMSLFNLNDAMWAQANEYNRHTLKETYYLRHGRDPPKSMKILETSALERNVAGINALRKAVAADQKRRGGEAGNSDTSGADGTELQGRGQAQQSADLGANLVPARAGAEQVQSPTSPTSPDEIVTPHDPFFNTQHKGPEGTASASGAAVGVEAGPNTRPGSTSPGPQTSLLIRKLTPLLRHDGHLHPHVSGLGGLSEAYDGRSYLPDDAEPDPEKIPSPPPGARIGDHPAIMDLRPHPLHVRGEKWHALLNPQPPEVDALLANGAGDVTANEEEGEEDEDAPMLRMKRQLAKLAVNKDEMGEGWGFVEGGSHGPGRGLGLPIPEDEGEGEGARKKRLKLTTDHKNPPKMACHFCRNRKIACGEGKSDDKTCNQCERRGIRCVFPTESRRGMRSRKSKSGHTVDGIPEALKDAEGYDDDGVGDPTVPSSSTSTSSSRGRGKPRGRPRGSGRGRGRASRRGMNRMFAVPEADETGAGEVSAVDNDFIMDEDGQRVGEGGAGQSFEVRIDANDPLATLAAETHSYEQLHGQQAVFSAAPETAQFTLAGGHNLGPFTRHPLNRRPNT